MRNGIFLIVILCFAFGFTNKFMDGQKHQLIVFEGSDWCSNCIRLEKNILSDADFIDYLENQNIELLRVDFPQRKKIEQQQQKANEAIAEKYDFQGEFPSIILSRTDVFRYNQINYKNQNIEEIKNQIQHKLEALE